MNTFGICSVQKLNREFQQVYDYIGRKENHSSEKKFIRHRIAQVNNYIEIQKHFLKSYTDELKRAYEGIDRCKEAVLNYQEYLEYYQKRLEDLENGADEFSLSDDTLIEKWLANEDERIKAYQDELEKFLNEEGDENES